MNEYAHKKEPKKRKMDKYQRKFGENSKSTTQIVSQTSYDDRR